MINSDFGKRRVVIYARVSTDHKEQLSALENQLDWYERFLRQDPNGRSLTDILTRVSRAHLPRKDRSL